MPKFGSISETSAGRQTASAGVVRLSLLGNVRLRPDGVERLHTTGSRRLLALQDHRNLNGAHECGLRRSSLAGGFGLFPRSRHTDLPTVIQPALRTKGFGMHLARINARERRAAIEASQKSRQQ
jgi:hypothetical protein